MVESLESFDPTPQVPHEGDDRKDDDGGQLGIDASRCSPGTPTYGRCEGEPSDLQSQQVPSVRETLTVGSQIALQCGLKWVWNDKVKKWEDRVLKDAQRTGSKGRSTLQPCRHPSATIAASSQAGLQATCKTNLCVPGGNQEYQCPYNCTKKGPLDQLLRDGSITWTTSQRTSTWKHSM